MSNIFRKRDSYNTFLKVALIKKLVWIIHITMQEVYENLNFPTQIMLVGSALKKYFCIL